MKITACYIVKNESSDLRRSIESLHHAYDELLVVDTGSTDDTCAVATQLGARVLHFSWCDDFSAARNFTIEQATGDVLVFLDADEYLADGTARNLRRILSRMGDVDALLLKRYDIDGSEQKILGDVYVLRIFRRAARLRFAGRIHEELRDGGQDIRRMAAIPETELCLYHTGYEQGRNREKAERNLRILLSELQTTDSPSRLYMYLAEAYHGLGDYEHAEAYARRDIAQGRRHVVYASRSYHLLLEMLAKDPSRGEERAEIAMQAVRDFPELPEFHAELAAIHAGKQDYPAAVREMQQALACAKKDTGLEPQQFDAAMQEQAKALLKSWQKRTGSLWPKRRSTDDGGKQHMTYREKRQCYERLTSAMEHQDWPQAIRLAQQLQASGIQERRMYDAVLAAYIDGDAPEAIRSAAEEYAHLFPLDGVAHFYLGRAALLQQDAKGAEAHFEQALQDASMPDWYRGAVYSIWATMCREMGEPARAAEYYQASSQYKDLAHGRATEYSNYLFNLHYLDKPQAFMLEAAKGYGRLFEGIRPYVHERKRHAKHKKIRIGYISQDLHFHVVAFFSYAFLHDYDKRRFEVYCYTGCVEDAASEEFKAMVDSWRNVRGLSDEQIAKLVHRDAIDILVDLSGHTSGGLLPVLAYKPAPIQVSGIGYFDTTGLPAVDYFLADGYTDPVEVPDGQLNDAYFTEKLLRLPHSHFCFMWHDNPQEPGPAPFQRRGYVTFGSFNNFTKVTDTMLAAWGRILARVPGSQLFLKAAIFNTPYGCEKAEARIQKAGIPLDRVIFDKQEAKYLQAYQQMDIALDTYPYPGGGTTCDALYMGVPVITLTGQRHNARFGYSLLMNAGLPELCACSLQEYEDKAVALAEDTRRLRRYHQVIRRQMRQSPVMQAVPYMMEVERLYTRIWLDWLQADWTDAQRSAWEAKQFHAMQEAVHRERWERSAEIAAQLAARENVLPQVWTSGAMSLCMMQDPARACWWLRHAISADTEHDAELLRMLVEQQHRQHHYAAGYEAACRAEACLQTRPAGPAFLTSLLSMKASCALSTGRAEVAVSDYRRAAREAEDREERLRMYSSMLMAAHNIEQTLEQEIRAHLAYNDWLDDVHPYAHKLEGHRHQRLRIGYLSPDFRQHVMFYFYYQMLAAHNPEQFEIYLYSLSHTRDGFTELARQAADHYCDIADLRYAQAAARIREDEIDILVDLAGHSSNSGLPILASRPAPVQVSGLGYMSATGMKQVDYFLTDGAADPDENAGYWASFHEEPVILTSQFCYTGRSDVPAPQGAPCRKHGFVTFGVFHRYAKFTDRMMGLWRTILERVPGSRLLIKEDSMRDDAVVQLAFDRMEAMGFDMDRVHFEGPDEQYMERMLDVDIMLDTYPYTGGGMTCDALYMGVPVVSRYGAARGSRFGLSILRAAGLGELAVPDDASYVQRAVDLASDPATLDILHRNLRVMLLKSDLMDTEKYIREVESAYREMWNLWQQGKRNQDGESGD